MEATLSPAGLSVEIKLPFIMDAATYENLGSIIKLTDSSGNIYSLSGYSGEEDRDLMKTIIRGTFPLSLFEAPESLVLIIEQEPKIVDLKKRLIIKLNKVNLE